MRKTHVADGTLQTLYPKPWRPGVALLKQATPDSVEYDGYRNAVIKGSELVLETGGKLLGKSSNSFSLLPLRWTGSTSRMYTPYRQTWPAHARRGQTLFFLSGQQKSYSSRLRRNSGGRGTQIETFVEDARALANAWTRQMEQNEVFLEPAIKKAVCVCFVLSFRMPRYGLGTAYQEERIQEAFLLLSSAHHRISPSPQPESRPPQNGTPRKRHSHSHCCP